MNRTIDNGFRWFGHVKKRNNENTIKQIDELKVMKYRAKKDRDY